MPKQVDHAERRQLIAEALMYVAAEHGPESVSLRHVATAAGVSTGMVQHYFRNKDEMMIFAMRTVADRVQTRLTAEIGTDAPPATMLRALLHQLLPLDDERRIEGRVSLAAFAYAASHPAVAAALREDNARLRTFIAEWLASTGGRRDPQLTATTLVALVDGLGMQVLSGAYSPSTALAAFDAQLAATLGDQLP